MRTPIGIKLMLNKQRLDNSICVQIIVYYLPVHPFFCFMSSWKKLQIELIYLIENSFYMLVDEPGGICKRRFATGTNVS